MVEAMTKEERALLHAARKAGATGTVIDLLARLEQVEAERDEARAELATMGQRFDRALDQLTSLQMFVDGGWL